MLFLIFINDIVDNIVNPINLFADDTSLYVIVNDPSESASALQIDIDTIESWSHDWLVNFNPSKSQNLLMSRKRKPQTHPNLNMSGTIIKSVTSHKHLGLTFASDASWSEHITNTKEKAWSRINIMRRLKFKLDRKTLEVIYISFIRPLLEYADVIWDNCSQNDKYELDKIQYEAARIVTGCTKLVSINRLISEVGWASLSDRRRDHKLILFYKMQNGLTPQYLSNIIPRNENPLYNLRNASDATGVFSRTSNYFYLLRSGSGTLCPTK